MFLTHCVMEWTVLSVLSLSLPVWSAVKVIQPYSVTAVDGAAKLQCFIQPQPLFHQIQLSNGHSSQYPYPDPKKVRVSLLRGLHSSQELCLSTLNIPELADTDRKNSQQCSAELTKGAVELTVSGLEATDTDIYRCGIEVLYPPPYLKFIGNGTLVHVLERSECPVQEHHMVTAHHGAEGEEEDEDQGEADRRTESASTPVVVLVTLVIIVLIIIIYLQTRQYQQVRRRELIRSVPGGPYKVDAVAISCDNSI
ncbi:cytotoxic T-lymphocyte protein 4 [Echeneis naucrates]|uniref:Cytotoxic T-lymphocyte protein 4-like n=1 Tax=Echeneis naucrates TaxID=173247 RepID=A0A665WY24_ECHNA|nr:cytotoxic T-lymphocyte protein 4-like [Echeneis naucrates]